MENENYGEIYKITNMLNQKKYIGQTKCVISGRKYGSQTRWAVHKYRALKSKNDCNFFYNSIRKNGPDNFKLEILMKCELKDLDRYEKLFIQEYNTIYPNGYNIEDGGRKNKTLNEDTKQKLSDSKRYKNMKPEDIAKVQSVMLELKLDRLPKGIQYSHDTIEQIEGFCVIYKHYKKLFSSVNRTLKEKLELAIEFHKICLTENKEKIKEFNSNYFLDSKIKTSQKRIPKHEEVSLAMKTLNIEFLPLYVRFEKRHNRFYVKKPDQPNVCFCKNNPIKSLKEALEYLKAPVVEGESYLIPQKT